MWKQFTVDSKYGELAKRVYSHSDFLNVEVSEKEAQELERRVSVQRPGHAISYV